MKAIIGAGVAGLSSALCLANEEIVVLEAGERPGGRIRGVEGGEIIGESNELMLSIAQHFDVALVDTYVSNQETYESRLVVADELLSVEDLKALTLPLLSKSTRDLERATLDPAFHAKLAEQQVSEYLTERGVSDKGKKGILAHLFQDVGLPIDKQDALGFLEGELLQRIHGPAPSLYEKGFGRFQVVNGTSSLTDAMAGQVDHRSALLLSSAVESVRECSDGRYEFAISGNKRKALVAESAICTAALSALPYIDGIEHVLSDEAVAAYKNIAMTTSGKILVTLFGDGIAEYVDRGVNEYVVEGIGAIWAQHQFDENDAVRKGLQRHLTVFVCGDQGAGITEEVSPELHTAALTGIESCFGKLPPNVEIFMRGVNWTTRIFFNGAYSGHNSRSAEASSRLLAFSSNKGFHLAGEALDPDYGAYMEGAARTGLEKGMLLANYPTLPNRNVVDWKELFKQGVIDQS